MFSVPGFRLPRHRPGTGNAGGPPAAVTRAAAAR